MCAYLYTVLYIHVYKNMYAEEVRINLSHTLKELHQVLFQFCTANP